MHRRHKPERPSRPPASPSGGHSFRPPRPPRWPIRLTLSQGHRQFTGGGVNSTRGTTGRFGVTAMWINRWLITAAVAALVAGAAAAQPPDGAKPKDKAKAPPDEEKAILNEIREAYKAPYEVHED